MEQYSVKGDSWTNDNELYLTYMDSLKNVVGRKQKSSTRSGVARTTGDPGQHPSFTAFCR